MHVFFIGFHKCGTESLSLFFRNNGLRVAEDSIIKNGIDVNIAELIHENIDSRQEILNGISDFDVFMDIELNNLEKSIMGKSFFGEVYDACPRAKFILNTQNKEKWILSQERLRGGVYFNMQMDYYKINDSETMKEILSKDWDHHIKDVKAYFSKNPEKLLEFNVDKDDPNIIVEFLPEYQLSVAHWDSSWSTGAEEHLENLPVTA